MKWALIIFTIFFSVLQTQGQRIVLNKSDEINFNHFINNIDSITPSNSSIKLTEYLKWEADSKEKLDYYTKQYADYYRKNEQDSALEIFNKCSFLYSEIKDTISYLNLLNRHIMFLTKNNQMQKSLHYLTEYKRLAIQSNDKEGVMKCQYSTGLAYYVWADYTTSLYHFIEALKYAEQEGIKVPYSYYHNAAACSRLAENIDLSIEYQLKALSIYKESEDYGNEMIICMQSSILMSYIAQKEKMNPAVIDSLYNEIKLSHKKFKTLPKYHQNRYNNAMLYYFMDFKNLPQKATKYFNQGEYLHSKLNNARIYYALNDFKHAADNYKVAYEMIRKNQNAQISYALDNYIAQNGFNKMKSEINELKWLNAKRSLIESAEKAKLSREVSMWQWAFFFVVTLTLCFYYIVKIKRHKQEEKRLKIENDKAVKAEQVKSLFLQNMSHEIRTPLNAIVGFNDLLNGKEDITLSLDDKEMMIAMLKTNVELLQTLVNDVLDMSKFESGTYKVRLTDINVAQICKTTVESIRGKLNEGVKLKFECDDSNLILKSDAQRLQQVLSNFLTNASKYTNEGVIKLSYRTTDDRIIFSVTDTGIGIKPEEAEDVFTRFKMLDKAKQGTGLGLHICKLIANLLKGKVYVDITYTKGARFVFELPIIYK